MTNNLEVFGQKFVKEKCYGFNFENFCFCYAVNQNQTKIVACKPLFVIDYEPARNHGRSVG